MKYCYTSQSVCHPTLTKEASSYSTWELTQKATTVQYLQNESL